MLVHNSNQIKTFMHGFVFLRWTKIINFKNYF